MRSPRNHGFTLVELMMVVGMIGILSAIAIVGYKRYINSAQSSEATAIITGIRAGEEQYKAETLSYLGCSGCGGTGCAPGTGTLTTYYPMLVPSPNRSAWVNASHGDYNCWKMLNVVTDGPVRFGYAVVAGNPGQALPSISELKSPPTYPATASDNPWFVIQAKGDRDGNGIPAIFASTSLSGEIIKQDESE